MKKFIAALACLVIVGCSSNPPSRGCPLPTNAPDKVDPGTVSDGNITLKLPDDFSAQKPHVWVSKTRNTLVVALSTPTDLNQNDYVDSELASLKGDPEIVLGFNKKTSVYGKPANVVLFRNNQVYVLSLISVNNKTAYHVACGSSLDTVDKTLPVCVDILDSVHIK